MRHVNINDFSRDSQFYGRLELVLTVKNFDLLTIRKRYIESRKNKSGKVGSVERRKVGLGGIVRVVIEGGKVIESKILATLKEPRGIASYGDTLSFSSENKVFMLTNTVTEINNPWFSYIHTIDFNKSGESIILSSSGFDALFEYNLINKELSYEWWAWENGFNVGYDPEKKEEIILSRVPLIGRENRAVVINDPTTQVLPTAMRAAFINSVVYDKEDNNKLLATFFHEGAVYSIDKLTGIPQRVVDGLKNPHGGERAGNKIMATSTGSGEVVISDEEGGIVKYAFDQLERKPRELQGMEWLQNSKFINGNIITIDSNRTSFVIFYPAGERIDVIPYNDNWAIQDMIDFKITAEKVEMINKLNNPSN